jgi:hypothetical protein
MIMKIKRISCFWTFFLQIDKLLLDRGTSIYYLLGRTKLDPSHELVLSCMIWVRCNRYQKKKGNPKPYLNIKGTWSRLKLGSH